MKPLFFRVLALLLGSFLVVVVISFLAFRWINEELEPGGTRMRALANEAAEELVENYRDGEWEEARRRLRRHRVHAWIEDEFGIPLSHPPAPPKIRRQISDFPQVVFPPQNRAGHFFIFTQPVTMTGETYHVIMTTNRFGFHRQNRWGFFWVPLAAMMTGLLVASAALSYWMLRPLRAFGQTARSISADNLHARLPERITSRRDAFGELGREFNGMTDRLELVLENQNQLLRDVSHELRSPLARIQVAASLWARKSGGHESYDRIENEVGRLDRLIGDLLSLSRIKSGYQQTAVTFDLADMLASIADDAGFEFSQENKSILLDTPDTATFRGDKSLVASAVENIVRNALRHSPEGESIEIHLSVATDSYLMTIRDRGAGVDEEKLDRIFEPFYQADEARGVGSGHHGIGLSLAKAVIELHRGNISATNADDGGFLVSVKLPSV